MENQHRKIKTYRELSQKEIDLMNKIKEKGQALLDLYTELQDHIQDQISTAELQALADLSTLHLKTEEELAEQTEYQRLEAAEPQKWLDQGKTSIQIGVSCLVRAVAQPTGC